MTIGKLRVLDLFSGIGGFSLGLGRAGMETVAFCEQDGYACRVLRKRWPTAPIFEDVKTLTKKRLAKHGIEADVICGGFPCQDISFAGKGAGLDGERSGLWSELCRLIREVRPRYALLENVAALRSRGLDRVLGDLAAIGYDAEWHCIPASALGAPHRRDRVWIVAYPHAMPEGRQPFGAGPSRPILGGGDSALPHAPGAGRPARGAHRLGDGPRPPEAPAFGGQWPAEPDLPRVVDGLPHRLDRLRCLGNAVVPQIVELIGRAIVADHLADASIKAVA